MDAPTATDVVWIIVIHNNTPKNIDKHSEPPIELIRLILEKTLEKHCPCLKVEEIIHTMDGLEFYKWKCSFQQQHNTKNSFIQQKFGLKVILDATTPWTPNIERNIKEALQSIIQQ
eukprot:10795009-Ditylum_brightwellii.AAC.1